MTSIEDPLVTLLSQFTDYELLLVNRMSVEELLRRGCVRTKNPPVGDYAEYLTAKAVGGKLASSSAKSFDVVAPDGKRLQVKSRVVVNPNAASERQIGVLRSWDFDLLVVLLFEELGFHLARASAIPVDVAREAAIEQGWTNSHRVIARDELLDRGEDWTEFLRSHYARERGTWWKEGYGR